MFFFDPLYLVALVPGLLLGLWAQARVKSTFRKYSQIPTRNGYTGADIARKILEDNGIYDVSVEAIAGTLSDHYDPSSKTLRLSEPVFGSRSMAAFGVAAHEVGHAIQHARGYLPLKFRSAWVPVAGIGSNLGIWIIIASIFMGGAAQGGFAMTLAWVGVGLFACTTLFTLVTLPVEFDASHRALVTLDQGGYVTGDELRGAKKVLDAAAMTYVAAFVSSLLTLLYWAFRAGLLSSSDD